MTHRDQFPEAYHFMNETYSFRHKPCRFEESSQPRRVKKSSQPEGDKPNSGSEELPPCPFKEYCDSLETSQYERHYKLFAVAYGKQYKVTLSEPTASIITRSEHHYNQDAGMRLSLRKHLYIVQGCDEESRLGFGCNPIKETDVFTQYIGFVDLRYGSVLNPMHLTIESPIAMGLLTPPAWLCDKQTSLITGNYGSYFGAHYFMASVYCTQDGNFGGAVCAQMSLCMALGMLLDRGSKIDGSFSLTYLANHPTTTVILEDTESYVECKRFSARYSTSIKETDIERVFAPKEGLTSVQCEKLISEYDVSPHLLSLDKSYKTGNGLKAVEAVLDAYIKARFPIILFLNAASWYPKDSPYGFEDTPTSPTGHAVTMIGTQVNRGRISHIVVHDPAGVPFHHTSFKQMIQSAFAYPGREEAHFIMCADKRIRRHAWNLCLELLRGYGSNPIQSIEVDLYTGATYKRLYFPYSEKKMKESGKDTPEIIEQKRKVRSLNDTTRYWCFRIKTGDNVRHHLFHAELEDKVAKQERADTVIRYWKGSWWNAPA